MKNLERHAAKVLVRLVAAMLSLLLLYVLWLLARVFLFDVFVIPTNSMLPTLQPGDRILVSKSLLGPRLYSHLYMRAVPCELHSHRLMGLRQVRRGDVVVFNAPLYGGGARFLINYVYAKRCLALPGDSLTVVDGYYTNSRQPGPLALPEEQHRLQAAPDSVFSHEVYYVYPFDAHVPWTVKRWGPVYVPRRGDLVPLTPLTATYLRHPIEWERGGPLRIDWDKGEVRDSCGRLLRMHEFLHNYYFMAGDDVCASNNSRYWGLVPEEYIIDVARTGRYRRHRFMRRLR